MKKKLLLPTLCLLFAIFYLCGCGKDEIDYNKAIQSIKNIDSYSCDLDINIKNAKQEIKYECKQFYDKKYGYRLDINNDRRFIYNKDKILVNDLKNNKEYKVDKQFDYLYKLSFLKEYVDLLYTDENIKNEIKVINDRKYQLIHLTIPGNNRNINKAIMYVKLEDKQPEKTVICDIKGNEVVSFNYKNFVSNSKMEKEIFYGKNTKE